MPLSLQADPSLKGFVAVLVWDGHPIYFTIKSLHSHCRAHVVTELEFFVVAWAIRQLHHFLYGK